MDANGLRKTFLDYFVDREHTQVASSGLIPHHPSAPMFTNSGMMQFVPYFLEEEPAPFKRSASVQKCVRLSGKHNDIGELGKTRRHLTFFEMLGNWSFGDYYKQDAIKMAWELCMAVGFDADRIWATVHTSDDEAEAIWHETIGLPMERIQRLDKDNFWEMGETGPCGPCSEIHYDNGPEWGAEGGPAHGGSDRFVEFWNLVFMQDFRAADQSLTPLPNKNIDTGAGLERWLMLLQNVPSVFDTDAIRPLIETAESISGKTYGTDARNDVFLRIIGDHARTMTFLINDGVTPSNEGRGYVLRSVIRRVIRRGYQLGIDKHFLVDMSSAVFDHMAAAYPDLRSNADSIQSILDREEAAFRRTLATGSALLEDELGGGQVRGEVAFKLHDTFGFPIELTEEMAEERGVALDRPGFDVAMERQRQHGRDAQHTVALSQADIDTYRKIVEEHGTTTFVGYAKTETKTTVTAVLQGDGDGLEVFLAETPFYAEGGGQVGDLGTITTPTGSVEVLDTTYALPGLWRHLCRATEGIIDTGQEATARIDAVRRDAIRRNHTGTHILHWALRKVLGAHVKQAGSLVAPDRLRFDFTHFEAVTAEQIREIEALANEQVLTNSSVRAYETTMDHAKEMGAMMFFGDKYGETVRVLEAGEQSLELCGGTHVSALGDIGPVKVVSESSIGSNMRRIEALTGFGTLERYREEEDTLRRAAGLLRTQPDDLTDAVERLLAQRKQLEDELQAAKQAAAMQAAQSLAAQSDDGVVVARLDGLTQDQLRSVALDLRDKGQRAVVIAGSPDGSRVAVVAAVAKDGKLQAGDLVAPVAKMVGGGGGKGSDFAMAGGRDPSAIDEALAAARERLLGA